MNQLTAVAEKLIEQSRQKFNLNIMKKVILILILIGINILFYNESKGQFAFNVSPGLQLNSAGFGYKIDKFVPFVGLHIMHGGININEKGNRIDYFSGDLVSYEDKYILTATAYIPTIGTKYFFNETNKLKAFGTLSLTKIFLSGKIEDSNDDEASSQFEEDLKKTRIWGGQIGFGTEYFFDNNFSIGGEFGVRLLHLRFKEEYNDELYNPNTGNYVSSKTKYDYKFNFNPTYIKLSLNFYFTK